MSSGGPAALPAPGANNKADTSEEEDVDVVAASQRRERLRAEREKRDRLAYVGTLAAGLVHEMRTPLNAVHLNAQLLAEDSCRLPEPYRAKFEKRTRRIEGEVKRLSQTLDEFLTFARPPRLDPVPSDLNHLLREVMEFSEPEFKVAGIKIISKLAKDMFPVVVDRGQFTHVMLNLFRNARDSIANAQRRDGTVTVTTQERDRNIEILVDDNGPGIAPGMEEKIFELFYSTKEKGAGLGLAIVRRIIEDHNGSIIAEESPKAGARFRITLPRGKFLEFKE